MARDLNPGAAPQLSPKAVPAAQPPGVENLGLSYAALCTSLIFGFSPNRAPLTATCWKISPPIAA